MACIRANLKSVRPTLFNLISICRESVIYNDQYHPCLLRVREFPRKRLLFCQFVQRIRLSPLESLESQ